MEFIGRYSCNNSKENEVQDILNKSVEHVHTSSSESSTTIALNLNISEITGSLFLCSATSVHAYTLQVLGVTCVINAAMELPDTPLPDNTTLYYRIDVQDSATENIKDHFEVVSDLIYKTECSGGKTLLHCIAGVSRSATLCIAYLMKYHRFSLLETFNYVKLRRPIIKPNCGFFRQLIEYEKDLFGYNTVSMVYNELLNIELPDVYDSQYKGVNYFRKKCRNARE